MMVVIVGKLEGADQQELARKARLTRISLTATVKYTREKENKRLIRRKTVNLVADARLYFPASINAEFTPFNYVLTVNFDRSGSS